MTEQEKQVQALYDKNKEAIGFDTKKLQALVQEEFGVRSDRARRLTEGLRAHLKLKAEDEALRLKGAGVTLQGISKGLGVSQSTVQAYIKAASIRDELRPKSASHILQDLVEYYRQTLVEFQGKRDDDAEFEALFSELRSGYEKLYSISRKWTDA